MISFRPQHPKPSRKMQAFQDADKKTTPVSGLCDSVPRLADAEHRVAGEDFISLKSVGIAKPGTRSGDEVHPTPGDNNNNKQPIDLIDTTNYNNHQQSSIIWNDNK